MAKVGLWLRGAQGKYAGAVLQNAAGGGTIIRENVTPSNPQTSAQVETRTGFKLMSQLASVMAPVIAIRRDGALSSRNVFFKVNWPFVTTNSNEAQISYENIQLTKSQLSLPGFSVAKATDEGVATRINFEMFSVPENINRVVFVVFLKSTESKLQYVGSVVADVTNSSFVETGLDVDFPEYTEFVCYAYGMIDSDETSTVRYGNMNVQNGVDLVRLLSQGSLSQGDYIFTETRGLTLLANSTSASTVSANEARVYVTASGSGSVTGGGTYAIGSSVTVVATPGSTSDFAGWKLNGSSSYVSTSASYTFTVTSNQTIDLVAVFESIGVVNP